jgi:hypothetical protein
MLLAMLVEQHKQVMRLRQELDILHSIQTPPPDTPT